jgi:hypothetical protein
MKGTFVKGGVLLVVVDCIVAKDHRQKAYGGKRLSQGRDGEPVCDEKACPRLSIVLALTLRGVKLVREH